MQQSKFSKDQITEEEKTSQQLCGSFTGFKLLAGKGPGVKIQISPIGDVETDLKSEFTSQGINQTLHRIYLNVKCRVNILTPFQDLEKEITNQVLLAENVIVGRIPNTYYNLEGINGSNALDIIEQRFLAKISIFLFRSIDKQPFL